MTMISIILPVYNAEEYLEQCLKSLLSQTYADIEIICMNDGSTDNSAEIIEKYAAKDDRLKSIRQENKGTEVARRRALSLCSGKYIMFCDSDDWYEPNMCEEMLHAIEDNDVDIAMCKTNMRFEIEEAEDHTYYFELDEDGKKEISNYLIDGINSFVWNKIFKREIIDRNAITFPESKNIRVAWDGFFVLEYLLASKNIFFLDKRLHNFRIREGSLIEDILRGKSENSYDVWVGFEEFYNILSSKQIVANNIEVFLKQYDKKTEFYFKNLPTIEDRIEVLSLSKAFFNSVIRDGDIIKSFRNKYLSDKLAESLDYIDKNKIDDKGSFLNFAKIYLQDIDIEEADDKEKLASIKKG